MLDVSTGVVNDVSRMSWLYTGELCQSCPLIRSFKLGLMKANTTIV